MLLFSGEGTCGSVHSYHVLLYYLNCIITVNAWSASFFFYIIWYKNWGSTLAVVGFVWIWLSSFHTMTIGRQIRFAIEMVDEVWIIRHQCFQFHAIFYTRSVYIYHRINVWRHLELFWSPSKNKKGHWHFHQVIIYILFWAKSKYHCLFREISLESRTKLY